MTEYEIAVVAISTIAGPILAVQAQKWIERAGERRRSKLQVFYWLMATRATRLANEHVQALNRIELEFRGRNQKEKKVRDAWRLYADKLNETITETESALVTWSAERVNLFTELLFTMSEVLGFNFDRVQLKRGVYYPRGHGDVELKQQQILAGLAKVLSGEQSLQMRITEFPVSQDAVAVQLATHEKIQKLLAGESELRVSITKD